MKPCHSLPPSCRRWAPLPAGPLRLVVLLRLVRQALLPPGPPLLPVRGLLPQPVPGRVPPQAQPAQD